MRFNKHISCTFLFSILLIFVQAQKIQRYNTFGYSVNEGLLQSTITDIAIDKNNFCWISFPIGIQKFDGENFIRIPVQPGLPDDVMTRLFKCQNGDLLISHAQGISKYEITQNKFVQIYSNQPGEHTPLSFIGEDEGVIYCYAYNGKIKGLNSKTFKIISETKTGLKEQPGYPAKFSDNIIAHKTGIIINSKLYLWNLRQGKLEDSSVFIPDISYFMLHFKNEQEIFYLAASANNVLQEYSFTKKKNTGIVIKGKDNKPVGRCVVLPWKNKVFISFDKHLFETDSTCAVLTSELVDFQNEPIGGVSAITSIKEDNYGNLYLHTVSGGIKKIIGNNYPIKYYGTLKKEENNILSILPDKKNNRILAGTAGSGLMVFDTLQHLIKHIKTLPGSNLPFGTNNIIKNNKGDYLLFNVGEKKVVVLKNDLSIATPINITSPTPENKNGIRFFGLPLFQNEKEAVIQTQGNIYKVSFNDSKVTSYEISTAYIMGGVRCDNFIITHGGDELIFLDASSLKILKKIPFKNTGNVRCFAINKEHDIYLGSNNGIYKIDTAGKILQHFTTQNGLLDDCIYAMIFDADNYLWCSTNKGIFRMNKNNSIFQLNKEDGLQENEFNTNVVAKADDGELFFGGVNGISSFYPASIGSFDEKINLFFTSIKVNNEEAFKDSAVWNITDINLPHDQNLLSFDFIAMANSNPGQYVYQYKIENIDREWIQNAGLQTVRYFLPPGSYVLKIYASRFFDKDAKPLKQIKITINPPVWQTWWFITGIILLAFAALAYSFNRYNQRKFQKKLAVLENEHRIQFERERISRDLHDSIGAYANAVLYKTELLQNENDVHEKNTLMNDLQFASKDIITSLRETVWALKQENYTEEECLLRIKNFIQALSRYYPHIQFKAEGRASAENKLDHTKALHVVRIAQEAITNAIKHSGATCISLSSTQVEGKWKLIIVDDGTSFDYETRKQEEHGNGLKNMNQRAIESAIKFTISSAADTGTKVTMLI